MTREQVLLVKTKCIEFALELGRQRVANQKDISPNQLIKSADEIFKWITTVETSNLQE